MIEVLRCIRTELFGFEESPGKRRLEVALEETLWRAAKDLIAHLVDEARRSLPDGAFVSVCLRALGTVLQDHAPARRVVAADAVRELVMEILRKHPEDDSVQNDALWVLAQVGGAQAIAGVLSSPAFCHSQASVRGCLWALSYLKDLSNTEAPYPLAWAERCELAGAVYVAMELYPSDLHLQKHAIIVLGALMSARAPDVVHEQAVRALPPIVAAMSRTPDDEKLQEKAGCALRLIVDGNVLAAAALKLHMPAVRQALEPHFACQKIARFFGELLAHAEGLPGLLQALTGLSSPSTPAQLGLLWAVELTDTDAPEVASFSAVEALRAFLFAQNNHIRAAAARALGHILAALVRSPDCAGQQIEAALEALLTVLRLGGDALAAAAPRDETRLAEALLDILEALGAAAASSASVAATLLQDGSVLRVAEALVAHGGRWADLVLLRRCLKALWRVAGPAALCAALEARPGDSLLRQAVFRELVLARQAAEDVAAEQRRALGLRVVRLASAALFSLEQAEQAAHAAAAGALGEYLGDLRPDLGADDRDQWEQGLTAVVRTLGHFCPRYVLLLCEALWALNIAVQSQAAKAAGVAMTERLLQQAGVPEIAAKIIREVRREESPECVKEALLTLGLLGGLGLIGQAMEAFGQCAVVQRQGCKAIVELYRAGRQASSNQELDLVHAAVRRAQAAFASEADFRDLQSDAELALGALGQMEPHASP